MLKYHKLIAAGFGFIAVLSREHLGIDLGDDWVNTATDGVIALASMVWVFFGRNQTN